MKRDSELWRYSRLRHANHEHSSEQDHRTVKRLNISRACFWRLLDGQTNAGRIRGYSNDQERAGSKPLAAATSKAEGQFIAVLFEVPA
jgi:hypothetical protein